MASSDSNLASDDGWARHYARASARRRARGFHRRGDTRRRTTLRPKLYAIAAGLFIAITAVALLLPR